MPITRAYQRFELDAERATVAVTKFARPTSSAVSSGVSSATSAAMPRTATSTSVYGSNQRKKR
jgi:hypothetical protein